MLSAIAKKAKPQTPNTLKHAVAAIDDKALTKLLQGALYNHPRLQKHYHQKHIASLSVAKDIDWQTGRQEEEDDGNTMLYSVVQAPCQDTQGLVRLLPEVTNLYVYVGGKRKHAVANVDVAFYALDKSDGTDQTTVSFTVRDPQRGA